MRERQSRDPVGVIALLIAVLAVGGMVLASPTLLPRPVREAVGLGPERVAEPPRVTDQGSYAFAAHQPGNADDPVGYDPCQRIRLRINPDGGPADAIAMVRSAMAEIEQDTGLRFDYQGVTDARPRWETATVPVILGRPRTVPVLVSWADQDEVTQLAGDVAGVGGSMAIKDGGRVRYVTGGVTLDTAAFTPDDGSERRRQGLRAIVLHELGHLVGLAHVPDRNELMYPRALDRTGFGPGDRAGLAKVGSTPARERPDRGLPLAPVRCHDPEQLWCGRQGWDGCGRGSAR